MNQEGVKGQKDAKYQIIGDQFQSGESCTKAIFVRCFHNEDMKVHAWSQLKDFGFYEWLQGPIAYLPCER